MENYDVKKLIVYQKVEHLLYQIYPKLINFPKAEKFALSQTIKENFFDLLKNIALANSVKSKRMEYLQTADGHLQVLKVLIDLSVQRKYISVNHHEIISTQLSEINKLLSGYIKSVRK